ncbi:MAG: hypothetical protein WBA07_28685 [Rivularia sp. (in: cyanobacteria)]
MIGDRSLRTCFIVQHTTRLVLRAAIYRFTFFPVKDYLLKKTAEYAEERDRDRWAIMRQGSNHG